MFFLNCEYTNSSLADQSFVLIVLPLTSFLTPLILIILAYPLSLLPFPSILSFILHSSSPYYSSASNLQQQYPENIYYYIPAGPTPTLFALLAQFSVIVPAQYTWRVGLGLESLLRGDNGDVSNQTSALNYSDKSITLTSKSLSYVPALQLAFCAPPGSLVSAMTGWAVGMAYMEEILPRGMAEWRVRNNW